MAKLELLEFVNLPIPASCGLLLSNPNVNGRGPGRSRLADRMGGGGGFLGDGGRLLTDVVGRKFVRAETKPRGAAVPGTSDPGSAYSSYSDAQYSAARAALVCSRRAKRFGCSLPSGASHVLRGGARRTLARNQILIDVFGTKTYCFMIISFVTSSSGTGRPRILAICFRTCTSTSGIELDRAF
jgi:hypothetical protein